MKLKKTLTSIVLAGLMSLDLAKTNAEIVGDWRFDEGSGSLVTDSSKYANNGICKFTSWSSETPSGSGNSLQFGGDGYIEVGYPAPDQSLNLEYSFTFESWAKLSTKKYSPILAKWTAGDENSQHHPYLFGIKSTLDGKSLRAFVKIEGMNDEGTGREFELLGNTSLQDNVWYHLGANYDGESLRVFVDGNLDGEILADHLNIGDTNYSLMIGRAGFSGASEPFFQGWLDDVKMSNDYYTPSVPEPSTLGMLSLGALSIAGMRRKRN